MNTSELTLTKFYVNDTYSGYGYVLTVNGHRYVGEDMRARRPSDSIDWDIFMSSVNDKHAERSTWSYEVAPGDPRLVYLNLQNEGHPLVEKMYADFGLKIAAVSAPMQVAIAPASLPIAAHGGKMTKYFVKIDGVSKTWNDNIHVYDDSMPKEYNNVIFMENDTLDWCLRYAY